MEKLKEKLEKLRLRAMKNEVESVFEEAKKKNYGSSLF